MLRSDDVLAFQDSTTIGANVRFGAGADMTRQSLLAWIDHAKLSNNEFLFPSRVADSPNLSTRQYARIVNVGN